MMKSTKFSMIAIAAMMATNVLAAKSEDAPTEVAASSANVIRIATGPIGKGYSKLFKDMQAICGKSVSLVEVNTGGGLDNLSTLSTKEADLGIAQVDTWSTMKRGDENIAALQGVMSLNYNYLHVVTLANGYTVAGEKKMFGMMKGDEKSIVINKTSDLHQKSVALVGSAQLLGRQLDKSLNMGMNLVDAESDTKAFDMLKRGQVAAVFTISGWPSGVLAGLKQDSGLTLVPFDMPIKDSAQTVRSINYKGLGVYNVNSLAMPNVLFTRPFKGERATQVANLQKCLTNNLEELKEGDYQPAWNEIKDSKNTFDVPKFVGSTSASTKK